MAHHSAGKYLWVFARGPGRGDRPPLLCSALQKISVSQWASATSKQVASDGGQIKSLPGVGLGRRFQSPVCRGSGNVYSGGSGPREKPCSCRVTMGMSQNARTGFLTCVLQPPVVLPQGESTRIICRVQSDSSCGYFTRGNIRNRCVPIPQLRQQPGSAPPRPALTSLSSSVFTANPRPWHGRFLRLSAMSFSPLMSSLARCLTDAVFSLFFQNQDSNEGRLALVQSEVSWLM